MQDTWELTYDLRRIFPQPLHYEFSQMIGFKGTRDAGFAALPTDSEIINFTSVFGGRCRKIKLELDDTIFALQK